MSEGEDGSKESGLRVSANSELTHTTTFELRSPKKVEVPIYYLREDQLVALERAGAGDVALNFALAMLGIAVGLTTTISVSTEKVSAALSGGCVATWGLAVFSFLFFLYLRGERRKVVEEIRRSNQE